MAQGVCDESTTVTGSLMRPPSFCLSLQIQVAELITSPRPLTYTSLVARSESHCRERQLLAGEAERNIQRHHRTGLPLLRRLGPLYDLRLPEHAARPATK